MALLRYKDISKMSPQERESKLNELKFELSRANVTANKANAKTKEIKKAISRINTLIKFNKSKKLLKEK